MTPPDADHPSSTPVVHLTRRAALAAERAARAVPAGRADAVGRETPAPVRAAVAAASPSEVPVPAAAPVSDAAPSAPASAQGDTRVRRVARRTVTAAPGRTTREPGTRRSDLLAPRPGRRAGRLTLTSAVAALAMFGASAMPAHAATGTTSAVATLAPAVTTQDFAVTQVALPSTSRDGFTVGAAVAATDVGATTAGTTTTDGLAVRSPFPGPVRMSSGFGYRAAPCAACSSRHQGLDFTPGMGAPIGAVAAGTVRVSGVYFSYGQTVVIDHVVDGRRVSTLYGHMVPGSSPVRVGDRVAPGQFIGSVGSSGVSTGAHLHLEVLMDGTLPVDPAAWLVAHTGRAL